MIEIPRALARQFRAVLRRSLMDPDPRGSWPVVLCRADRRGLTLEASQGDLAVRHRQEGNHAQEVINFPGGLLAEIEGRADQPVSLEIVTPTKGRARWTDGAVPRAVEFDMAAPDSLPTLPEMPKEYRELPNGFLTALGEAARTTARESIRYGLVPHQLRGRAGQIVATDGQQLLIQGDFTFPWPEDVLVPRLPVFGHREVTFEEPVRIGRAKDVILLESGPWTFLLRIDKDARFPDTEHAIPASSAITSRLCLDPDDLAFLVATLPKLPGADDDHSPVTLDFSRPPVVRTKADGEGPVTEVVLMRSNVSGKSVRLNLDRRLLLRALKLGFHEVQAVGAETAIICRDSSRVYVFMPLDPKTALASNANAVRVASADGEVPDQSLSPERTQPIMPAPQPNDNPSENNGRPGTPPNSLVELITEAEALRDLLHEATGRTARLVAALKQQRRQTRAVQQAMQSLQQLRLDR